MASKLCRRDGNASGVVGLSLPEEIVVELLVRLPAKALCRFRCVSKAWRAIISDPAFVAVQKSRAGPVIVAAFGSETRDHQQLRLLDKDGDVIRVFDVMGTATLAATRLGLIFVDMRHLGAMIIDPASGHVSTVFGNGDTAPPQIWPWPLSDYSFGRAMPSGDYKVLHVTASICEVATVIDDGSIAELTWRQKPRGPHPYDFCERKAVVNGVLYFLPFVTFYTVKYHIVAFDLESEEWEAEIIRGPTFDRKEQMNDGSIALAELKGNLCLVHNVYHLTCSGDHYADIWVLKDPSRSIWVNEYTIHMPESLLLFSMPLEVLGDGRILLLLNAFWKAGGVEKCPRYILQFYNSDTKAVTDFMEMPEGFNGRMAFYTGSFLS